MRSLKFESTLGGVCLAGRQAVANRLCKKMATKLLDSSAMCVMIPGSRVTFGSHPINLANRPRPRNQPLTGFVRFRGTDEVLLRAASESLQPQLNSGDLLCFEHGKRLRAGKCPPVGVPWERRGGTRIVGQGRTVVNSTFFKVERAQLPLPVGAGKRS